MKTGHEEHYTTNFGVEVTAAGEEHPHADEKVIPAHVDEHAREELLAGHDHPEHGTNFGIVLPETEH